MAKEVNDVIKLSEGFKLVPEGEDVVLKVEKIEAKPKAKPSVIEAVFLHEETGAKINNKYDLNKEGGLLAFSFLARCVLGRDIENFSISKDLPKLKGVKIECEVIHQEYNGNTYANIKRTIALVEDEVEEDEDL